MIKQVSPTFLKQEAKKRKKSQGLSMSKALDKISKKFGFFNYKHYRNFSKKYDGIGTKSIAQKLQNQKIPTKITGGFKKVFKDIFELLDKPDEEAYVGLMAIIKNDPDSFRKLQATQALLNNFDVTFSKVLSLIKDLISNHLMMVWPYLKLDEEIESELFEFYLNDGQSQLDSFSPHSSAEDIYLDNIDYSLSEEGLAVTGAFELSVRLQYGSDSDLSRNNGAVSSHNFFGKFIIEVDQDKQFFVKNAEIDDSSFY